MCSRRRESAASEKNNTTKEKAERRERKDQGQNSDCFREAERSNILYAHTQAAEKLCKTLAKWPQSCSEWVDFTVLIRNSLKKILKPFSILSYLPHRNFWLVKGITTSTCLLPQQQHKPTISGCKLNMNGPCYGASQDRLILLKGSSGFLLLSSQSIHESTGSKQVDIAAVVSPSNTCAFECELS